MGGNALGDKVSWLSGGGVKKDVRPRYDEPGNQEPIENMDMDTKMKSNKRKLKKKIRDVAEYGTEEGKKRLIEHFKKKIKTI